MDPKFSIELDADGYPTESTLRMFEYCMSSVQYFTKVMEALAAVWRYPERVTRQGDIWRVSTGGWSGNEDVIGALRQNHLWWTFYCRAWSAGGHYVFSKRNVTVELVVLNERKD